MRGAMAALAIGLLGAGAAQAACAPKGTVRIAYRTYYPQAPWLKPSNVPDLVQRAGSRFVREGSADGTGFSQVIAIPDVWWFSIDGSFAWHWQGTGIVASVFETDSLGETGKSLEFGCEADFVRARMGPPRRSAVIRGVRVQVYRLDLGENAIEAALSDAGTPVRLTWLQDGDPNEVIEYDRYEQGEGVWPEVFTPPPGMKFKEGPPPPPKLIPRPPDPKPAPDAR